MTMDRPGFRKLLAGVAAGKVARIVVWRIDRPGRTAKGLTALFEDLMGRGVDPRSADPGATFGEVRSLLAGSPVRLLPLVLVQPDLRPRPVRLGR
jgi:DNA invertase Pin-like site-specific DNA recombinase